MGSCRSIGVEALSFHSTKTNSALKILKISYRVAVLIAIIGLAGSVATSAQALPRPTRRAANSNGAHLNKRVIRRSAWKRHRAADRPESNSANAEDPKAGKMKSWKEASLPCYHFYPEMPVSDLHPVKVADAVCSFGKSCCWHTAKTSCQFALFAFTVFAGGVAGVALLVCTRQVTMWSALLWKTSSTYAQAIFSYLAPILIRANRGAVLWLPNLATQLPISNPLLLGVKGAMIWLLLPWSTLMAQGTRLLVRWLVRMWFLWPQNGREIKSAGEDTICAYIFIASSITVVCLASWRYNVHRRRISRSVRYGYSEDTAHLQAGSGEALHNSQLCNRCWRPRPGFDSWLHSYLAARGIQLNSQAELSESDARDIQLLIRLHGSAGTHTHLPSIISRARSKPHTRTSTDLHEYNLYTSRRPVEVYPATGKDAGSLFFEAKSELTLHCQCPERISGECGGKAYSAEWAHPSGEEISGSRSGEEQEGEGEEDDDATESEGSHHSDELIPTIFPSGDSGASLTSDELGELNPFGIIRMEPFDPHNLMQAFGVPHPNSYRGALADRSQPTSVGEGSVRRNEIALLVWCRSWDGGYTIPVQAPNLTDLEVQNWFTGLVNYTEEEGLQSPPFGVHIPDFEMIPPWHNGRGNIQRLADIRQLITRCQAAYVARFFRVFHGNTGGAGEQPESEDEDEVTVLPTSTLDHIARLHSRRREGNGSQSASQESLPTPPRQAPSKPASSPAKPSPASAKGKSTDRREDTLPVGPHILAFTRSNWTVPPGHYRGLFPLAENGLEHSVPPPAFLGFFGEILIEVREEEESDLYEDYKISVATGHGHRSRVTRPLLEVTAFGEDREIPIRLFNPAGWQMFPLVNTLKEGLAMGHSDPGLTGFRLKGPRLEEIDSADGYQKFLKTVGFGPLEKATPVSEARRNKTPNSRTGGRARRSLAFDIDSPSSENLDELKQLLAANFPSSLATTPYGKLSDVKLSTRTLYEGAPIDTAEKSDAILQRLSREKNLRLTQSCGQGHSHWCTTCYEEKAAKAKEQLVKDGRDPVRDYDYLAVVAECQIPKGHKYCTKCPATATGALRPGHPALKNVSSCLYCERAVDTKGKVMTGCPHCGHSFTQAVELREADDSRKNREKSEVYSILDYNMFSTVVSAGGHRPHLQQCTTPTMAMDILMNQALKQSENDDLLKFPLTPRLLYYAPKLAYGHLGMSDGKKQVGLTLVDFQSADIQPLANMGQKAMAAKAKSTQQPKWDWHPNQDDAGRYRAAHEALVNFLKFFIYIYGQKYQEDTDEFFRAVTSLRSSRLRARSMTCERWITVVDSCLQDYSRRIRAQAEDFTVDQRFFVEKSAPMGGDCIRLLYSNQLESILTMEALIERRAHSDIYESITRSSGDATTQDLVNMLPVTLGPSQGEKASADLIKAVEVALKKVKKAKESEKAKGAANQETGTEKKKGKKNKKSSSADGADEETGGKGGPAPGLLQTSTKPCKWCKQVYQYPLNWKRAEPPLGCKSCWEKNVGKARQAKEEEDSEDESSGLQPEDPKGDATALEQSFTGGGGRLPNRRALTREHPLGPNSKPICAEFLTPKGCPRGEECSLLHVKGAKLTPSWALHLSSLGGLADQPLRVEEIGRMPNNIYAQKAWDGMTPLEKLTNTLSLCAKPSSVKLDLSPIREGKVTSLKVLLYNQSPLPLFTRGGLAARHFYQAAFGAGDCILQGILTDVGSDITRADGSVATSQCFLRALCAQLPPSATSSTDTDALSPAQLEVQVRQAIDSKSLEDYNPGCRAASLLHANGSQLGWTGLMPLWLPRAPELLSRYNILHLEERRGGQPRAIYMPASRSGIPRTPLEKGRINTKGAYDPIAEQAELLCIMTLKTPSGGRHTYAFDSIRNQLTHSKVTGVLARMASEGQIDVLVQGRGNFEYYNNLPLLDGHQIPFSMVEAAWLANHRICQHMEELTSGQEPQIRSSAEDEERTQLLLRDLLPKLQEGAKDTADRCCETLRPFAQFCTEWLLAEIREAPPQAKNKVRFALENMLLKWRDIHFEGLAGEYDLGPQRLAELQLHLGPEMVKVIVDNCTHGVKSMFMGDRRQYNNHNHPGTEAAELKILQDFLGQAKAKKSFIFLDTPEVRKILLEGRCMFNPMFAVLKRNSDSTIRLDEAGNQLWRPVVDGCNSGHSRAPNEGIYTGSHPYQITTSYLLILRALLRVESDHPDSLLMGMKFDISDAFRMLMFSVKDLGLYTHAYGGYINLNLALVFGGTPCPALWEVYSNAVEIVSNSLQGKDRSSALQRMVDDFLKIQTLDGKCEGPQHLEKAIQLVCNQINEEKRMTLRTEFHAFGPVFDTVERTISAPWSKLLKLARLAQPLVNQEVSDYTADTMYTINGVYRWLTITQPSLLPLLTSRLSRVLEETSGLKGSALKGKMVAPKLAYESPEEGWAEFRKALSLVCRLALEDRGEWFRVPYEKALPLEYRRTFPGQEQASVVKKISVDASGTAMFGFNHLSGLYFQHTFDEADQELFNRFDEEWGTTIALRELVAACYSICLLSLEYEDAIIDLAEDNQNVVAWLEGKAPSCRRASHLLTILSLVSLATGNTIGVRYIPTDKNTLADAGTRNDKGVILEACLENWSAEQHKSPRQVEIPECLKNLGWNGAENAGRETVDPLGSTRTILEWMRAQDGVSPKSRVRCERLSKVLSQVSNSAKEKMEVPEFDADFLDQYPVSEARKACERLTTTRGTVLRSAKKVEGGVASDHSYRDMHRILHQQLQKKVEALACTNPNFSAERVTRLEAPHTTPVIPHIGGLKVFNGCAGTGAILSAFNDLGLGEVVGGAEPDPVLRGRLEEQWPEGKFVRSLAEVSGDLLTHLEVDVYTVEPPCRAHSRSNTFGKGAAEEDGAIYQNCAEAAMAAQGGKGVKCILVECVPGVEEDRASAGKTPLMLLLQKLQRKYVTRYWRLRADACGAPINHERTYVVGVRKDLASSESLLAARLPGTGEPKVHTARQILTNCEGMYLHMPLNEVRELEPATSSSSYSRRSGLLRVASASYRGDKAPVGKPPGAFPAQVYDATHGLLTTATASVGGQWITQRLGHKVVVRLPSNLELARAYGVRHYPISWLQTNSEHGLSAIGNSIPQYVADELSLFISDMLTKDVCHREQAKRSNEDEPTGSPMRLCGCGEDLISARAKSKANPNRPYVACRLGRQCRLGSDRVFHFTDYWTARALQEWCLCTSCRQFPDSCFCPRFGGEVLASPVLETLPIATEVVTVDARQPSTVRRQDVVKNPSASRNSVAQVAESPTTPTSQTACNPPASVRVSPGGVCPACKKHWSGCTHISSSEKHALRQMNSVSRAQGFSEVLNRHKADHPAVKAPLENLNTLQIRALPISDVTFNFDQRDGPQTSCTRCDEVLLGCGYVGHEPSAGVWCRRCGPNLPFSTVHRGQITWFQLQNDDQLGDRRIPMRKVCSRVNCQRRLPTKVRGQVVLCTSCTHGLLGEPVRGLEGIEPDELCKWCGEAECWGCTGECPVCQRSTEFHKEHCYLSPPWNKPRITPEVSRLPLAKRLTVPCPCTEEEGRGHLLSCPKRQERLVICAEGPDLWLKWSEDRSYLDSLSYPQHEEVEAFWEAIKGHSRGVLVRRKYWLHLTEGLGWLRNGGVPWVRVPEAADARGEDKDEVSGQCGTQGFAPKSPLCRPANEDRISYEIIQAEIKSRLAGPKSRPSRGKRYPWMSEETGQGTYREVKEFSDLVLAYNQGFYTAQSDKRGFEAWAEYCAKRACSVFLLEGKEAEFQENVIQFCAYDAAIYGNKANTISARVGSIVAAHKRNLYEDPTPHLPAVRYWLSSLRKLERKKEPKYPYPSVLLWSLLQDIHTDTLDGLCLQTALIVGFTFLLRSCMYLKTPKYQNQLLWRHVQFLSSDTLTTTIGSRDVSGPTCLSGHSVEEEKAGGVRLYLISPKNNLNEVTRTLPRTGTLICPVEGLVRLYRKTLELTGKVPNPDTPVFQLSSGKQLNSVDVNSVLKDRALKVGLPLDRIGTHSLRRGGVTAYLAAGANRKSIQIFGFWYCEDTFLQYEWLDSGALHSSAFKMGTEMPTLELQL